MLKLLRILASVYTRSATFLHVRPLSFNGIVSISLTYHLVRKQPHPATSSHFVGLWIRLILSYARHRKLFTLRVEDAETQGNDWDEILRNDRINRA